ncbi:transglycosylase SLT domain-containing protein [soil metagenome]
MPCNRYFATAIVLLLLSSLTLTTGCERDRLPESIERDWASIVERDTLVALVVSNSTSYFVYRGQPMGFEFDLLRAFAREKELEFEVRVVSDRDSLTHYLRDGSGDIAAARLIPPDEEETPVAYTTTLFETEPVIVQTDGRPDLPERVGETLAEGAESADTLFDAARPDRRMLAGDAPERVEIEARLITRPQDLADATVHLEDDSPFRFPLVELSDQITGDVYVVEVTDASLETLMRSVAYNEIDLTVAPGNLARMQAARFDNLVVEPAIGDAQPRAWAVRPNAPQLLQVVNEWLDHPKQQSLRDAAYQRYYIDRRGYRERVESEYLSTETGRLSEYDDLFREHAAALNWDWRLLASMCYQESKFEPRAVSWAGAAGLLQLMPPTAREFGVTNSFDPVQNVAGAVRFIQWLYNYWDDKIPDEDQRLRFIIASYNTGHGHVEDARRLTAKAGGNDNYWPDVAFWLLQKSDPAVYRDPVVRFGFSRGLEPVTYVALILERYAHYRQFVTPADGELPPQTTPVPDSGPVPRQS